MNIEDVAGDSLTVRLESRSTNGAACVRDKMSSARGREEEEVRKEQGKAQYAARSADLSRPAAVSALPCHQDCVSIGQFYLLLPSFLFLNSHICRWGGIQSRSNGVYMAPDIYMQEILLRYS